MDWFVSILECRKSLFALGLLATLSAGCIACGGTEIINLPGNKPKPDVASDTGFVFPENDSLQFPDQGGDKDIRTQDQNDTAQPTDSLTDLPTDQGQPTDQTTVPDDKEELPPPVTGCVPHDAFCVGNVKKTCNPAGTDWIAEDCEDLVCVYGECKACFPGTRRCDGATPQQCAQDGSGFENAGDCDFANTGKICANGSCIEPCKILQSPAAATMSNVGCEYWGIDMDQSQEYDGYNAQYAIVVSNTNSYHTATVKVSTSSGEVKSLQAPPNTATIIPLDPLNIIGVLKGKYSYRVESNLPIVAYQFNPLENVGVFSNDASLLLPTYALGKQYMVMAWPHRGGALASNFAVVATLPGTTVVTIRPSVATAAGGDIPAVAAGQEYSVSMEQYDVLNIESSAAYSDLTGSLVTATQNVAVFGGHVCANCPAPKCKNGQCPFDPDAGSCSSDGDCPIIGACDHLEEQLQPLPAWGLHYVVGKTWMRGKAPDYIRVLASEDGTTVTLKPMVATVPTLNAGQYFDFETLENLDIQANKPILVGQFLEGQDAPGNKHEFCESGLFGDTCGGLFGSSCDTDADCSPNDANIGDPAFIVGVPVEQYRPKYVFLVPTKYAYNYVTIVAPVGAQVTIDSSPSALTFKPVPGGTHAVAELQLSEGSHVLQADKPVGITVYGWDQYVSYGYPGGMNLESL